MATPKKNKQTGSKNAKKKVPLPPSRSPWKRSWNVLWGLLSVIGELVLIFLVKGNVIQLGTVQLVVLFIGIPILAHLLISGLRQFLYLISPRL